MLISSIMLTKEYSTKSIGTACIICEYCDDVSSSCVFMVVS